MESVVSAAAIAVIFFVGYLVGFARGVVRAPEVMHQRLHRDRW